MNAQLPKEFIQLNSIVKEFNTGNNVKLLGEGKYLLLQGSKAKGYSVYVVDEKQGKRIVKALVVNTNKTGIIAAFDLLERILLPDSRPEYLTANPGN